MGEFQEDIHRIVINQINSRGSVIEIYAQVGGPKPGQRSGPIRTRLIGTGSIRAWQLQGRTKEGLRKVGCQALASLGKGPRLLSQIPARLQE